MTVDWTKPIEYTKPVDAGSFDLEFIRFIQDKYGRRALCVKREKNTGYEEPTVFCDDTNTVRNRRETWERWLIVRRGGNGSYSHAVTESKPVRNNWEGNGWDLVAIHHCTITEGEGLE